MIEDMRKYQNEYHKDYWKEYYQRPEIKEKYRLKAVAAYALERQKHFEKYGVEKARRPNFAKESYCRQCKIIYPKGTLYCSQCNGHVANKPRVPKNKDVVRY